MSQASTASGSSAKAQPKINKEAIKTLVVAYGAREAARKAGISENTVLSWCSRYNWPSKVTPDPATQSIRNQSPADALATTLQNDSNATRIGFSRAARKVAGHLAEQPDSELVRPAVSISASKWAAVASNVHGWQEQKQEGFSLQVLSLGDLAIRVNEKQD